MSGQGGAKDRTRPPDEAPARSSSVISRPVTVGPHMSGARPGVEMRTRRSPTATWRARGLAGRTPMTRCDVSFASNDTPSGPGGARTSRMCSFATTGSAVTTSASYTMSLAARTAGRGCLYKLLLLALLATGRTERAAYSRARLLPSRAPHASHTPHALPVPSSSQGTLPYKYSTSCSS